MSGAGLDCALLPVGIHAAHLTSVTERRPLAHLLLAGLTIALGMLIESRLGKRTPQGWDVDFSAVCLVVTFGSTGFIWRMLRKQATGDGST